METVEGGADSANDFTGPEFLTEQHERTILEIADSTEKIVGKSRVVGIDAAAREFPLDFRIAISETRTGARAKRLVLETVEKFFECLRVRSGNDKRAVGSVAIGDVATVAKIANAVQMAEEIERPWLRRRSGEQDASPDFGGIGAADGLAIFVVFGEFDADGADVRAEVERFYFEHVHGLRFRG